MSASWNSAEPSAQRRPLPSLSSCRAGRRRAPSCRSSFKRSTTAGRAAAAARPPRRSWPRARGRARARRNRGPRSDAVVHRGQAIRGGLPGDTSRGDPSPPRPCSLYSVLKRRLGCQLVRIDVGERAAPAPRPPRARKPSNGPAANSGKSLSSASPLATLRFGYSRAASSTCGRPLGHLPSAVPPRFATWMPY